MNSLERIFRAAWQKFIVEQAEPAVKLVPVLKTYGCCYLDEHGNKCAVGLCIPDGHEAQKFDFAFAELVDNFPDLFPDLCGKNEEYLDDFQRELHDNLIDVHNGGWRYRLELRKSLYKDTALKYGLNVGDLFDV